jgi:GNAT superfamily N-acetyltransferase
VRELVEVPVPEGFELSTDSSRVDRELVHRWLSEEAYWALGRERAVQDRAIDSSRNYGLYRSSTGEQVAFARVVTDSATFAWLCDVFVDASVRGQGIGSALVAGVCADLEPLNLRRVVLATGDAHGVYAKFGFEPLPNPDRWMSLARGWRPTD